MFDRLTCSAWIGAALAAFGLAGAFGWLAPVQGERSGQVPLEAAVLFVLCGLHLGVGSLRPRRFGMAGWRWAVAAGVLGWAALVLARAGWSGGWTALSGGWPPDGQPARLAPDAALAFAAAGGVLLLGDVAAPWRWLGALRIGLLALVAGLGLTALLGYLLGLEGLYAWTSPNRMALFTALALCLLALGAMLTWPAGAPVTDDRRIATISLWTLVVVAAVSGLTGFALFNESGAVALRLHLQGNAQARAELFELQVQQAARLGELAAHQPAWSQGDTEAAAALRALVTNGFVSARLADPAGQVLAQAGTAARPALALPLRFGGATATHELLWADGFVLRSVLPIGAAAGASRLQLEQRLPLLDRVFAQSADMGRSGEYKVCGRTGDWLDCFPSRLVPQVHRFPFFKGSEPSYPVARALLGQSGVSTVTDFRGVRVLAAHVPIGTLGLGLVAKMNASEVFGPVRSSASALLLLPALLLLAGGVAIRRGVAPLAARLVGSERRSREDNVALKSTLVDLQRTTEALLRSEERARVIVESSYDAYVATDREGRVTAWNAEAARLFGWSADEALDRPLDELIIPERFRQAHRQGLERLRRGGTTRIVGQRLELPALCKSGQEIAVELTISAIGDGPQRWFSCFLHDIGERKAAEMQLADSERRFRLMVEGVRDHAIVMLDPQGRITGWNQGAERAEGYAAEEIVGQHLRRFFSDEDRAAGVPERLLLQASRDGSVEEEGWRLRKDGSRFWAGMVLTALRADDGELLGFAKLTRDLSEHRRQQDLLTQMAELSPSAMLLIDAEDRIVLANAQAETMFGHARSELLGQPLNRLLPARLHPPQRGAAALLASSALHGLRRDGTEFPIEVGLSPIETAQGPAVLAAIFDITERRQQQAHVERALQEKETLLKEVYHRVKNNLQVIQSLLSLQRRSVAAGPARNAIEDSVQRVRAMALVHEKLYQSGNLAAVPLPDYARDLLTQLADATGAGQRGIALVADIAPLDTGLDSAVPFGLLLTELISNGLKHGFPDGRRGTVRIALRPVAGGAELTVSDDGVGFPPGFDAARSTSMGLKLAASLAGQLGGELKIRSDGGAHFSAVLTRL